MWKIEFKSRDGWLTGRFGRYENGHLGIQLFQDGFPFCKSTNLVDIELDPREFHFNANSNCELFRDIMDSGHFEDTGREDVSGFNTYAVLRVKDHIEIIEG